MSKQSVAKKYFTRKLLCLLLLGLGLGVGGYWRVGAHAGEGVRQPVALATSAAGRAAAAFTPLGRRVAPSMLALPMTSAALFDLGEPDLTTMNELRTTYGWGPVFSWSPNTNPCSASDGINWGGVGCDNNRVVSLILGCGTRLLDQQSPQILTSLAQLQELNARGCNLQGSLAFHPGAPPQLHTIRFDINKMSGTLNDFFPDGISPTQFPNLGLLNLANNDISGQIPTGLMDFSSDTTITLNANRLSGTLPPTGNPSKRIDLAGNALEGVVPDYIRNAPGTGTVKISYNKFDVINTPPGNIDTNDPTWRSTQTVPPTNVSVTATGAGTASLTGTPIAYTAHGGYYEVLSSTTPSGPYVSRGTTANSGAKTASNLTVSGLPAGTNYFVVRTFTPAHIAPTCCISSDNKNDLTSVNSAEVSAAICTTNPVVTNSNDSGTGSLREAIATACPGSTITFVNGLSQITLTSGELLINKNLTIQGPGANLLSVQRSTAQGTPDFRIFNVSSGVTATIDALTVANGKLSSNSGTNLGGGIYNNGTLTLTNSVISGNAASGFGVLGGGIFNGGTLTITGSTVSGNSATSPGQNRGGGIYNSGTLTLTGSTISGNSASGSDNLGGGIANRGSMLKVINSTLSGNSATNGTFNFGGGIFTDSGVLTLTNSTLSGNTASNGGGIFNNGVTVSSGNTIIAGNTAPNGPDFNRTLNSNGFNLIGNTSFATITGTTTGNILNTNALLAPLGNYGGPTQTMALLPGSPALNAGSNALALDQNNQTLTTDQRGASFNRQVGGTVDIGAFESRGFSLTIASGNNQTTLPNSNFAQPLSVTVTPLGTGEPVNGGLITFTLPTSGASATIAGSPATITNGTATSGTLTANATSGTYTVTASANGAASVAFTLTNNLAPTVVSIQRAHASPTNAASVQFTVTFSESVTGVVADNFTLVPGGTVTGVGLINANVTGSGATRTVTVNTGTGSGTLGLNLTNSTGVTDSDGAGLANLPFVGQVYTIDKNAPDTTISGNPTNPTASNSASFIFNGSDTGGAGVAGFECRLDGGSFAACTSPRSYTGLSDGAHTFQVRAVDAAGNVDATPASFNWTVDLSAPDTIITGQPPNPSGSTSASLAFIGADNTTPAAELSFECKLDGAAFAPCTSPQHYSNLSLGSHTFQVRAIDAAGNADPTPASYNWNINSTPVITPTNLTRAAGSATARLKIATASDVETPKEQLVVQISSDGTNFSDNVTTGNVTIALVDQNDDAPGFNPTTTGEVVATVTMPCNAAIGSLNLFLRVTDATAQHDTKLWTLTSTSNSAPVLGYSHPTVVSAGTAPVINPATGPGDNGTINPLVLQTIVPATGLALSLNQASGQLQVISATLVGNYTVTVTASDNCGAQTYASFTVQVACPTITLSPASLPNASVNAAYPATLSATPAGANYSFNFTSGALPAGLTLNANGTFNGAPTQSGVFNFRVTATGWGGCTAFRDYTLLVTCAQAVTLNPASLPSATVGTSYGPVNLTATPTGSYSFAVTSGALPPGLTLNAATGVLAGTPSSAGTYNFRIAATQGSCGGWRDYTLVIGCAGVTISPASLPAGTAGASYNQALTSSPVGSYTFSLASGSLPAGLSLSSAGLLSGMTNVAGSYNFTVKAQAANGCGATQSYTLALNCPTITLPALPTPTLQQAYNQTLSATPTGGQYSFAVTSGALPTGLTLNAATGVLSGTPTTGGTYNFTITATGFGSCTGARAYSFTLGSSCPTIRLPASLPNGQPGQLYNHSVAATPSGHYSYAVIAGALPPGVTLHAAAGLLFGYPTAAGTYNFTLKATDSNQCTAERAYTVQIGATASRAAVAGDFDGDGKSDWGVWRGLQSEWLVLRSSDQQLSTLLWGTQAAPYHDVTATADYDGDGKMDWAVYRRANGNFYVKCSSNGAVLSKAPGAGDVPVSADYDGDGKTDFAVWQSTTGVWTILRSNDGTTQMVTWGLGSAPYLDLPVTGDYDGDGKADLAVFRRGNGTWYIRRSSDDSVLVKAWGLGSDVPVADDYDGDGKCDLAVWRGATGNWYVLRSADGNYQITPWGATWAGDVAVPGDYDGDGKCDLAVWRAPEGKWYVRQSSDNTTRTQSHGQNGDQPVTARQQP